MKRLFTLLSVVWLCATMTMAQVYTRQCDDEKLARKAQSWLSQGKWRNGFQKAMPHRSVNAVDFYEQYRKNPKQWKAMFKWLEETDLLTIAKGKHPIEGTTLVASVEDSQNQSLLKRQSESHYHHIDFQYVVKGKERFGLIDHQTSTPNVEWRDDVIHYDYDVERALFYDSNPQEFFIFFPDDWHIAKVENDTGNQQIRVIVIKVDYVE